MSSEDLKNQILVESEKLAQLTVDYREAEEEYSRRLESNGLHDGGSGRQENLREQQLRDSADRIYKAKSALEAQQQLVAELKAANGQ
ncbi:hypothetical protein [Rheinheimera fenheensis]|uniref:hypothetical protein n=1 Tax=Rheinheimera fenheensis TaxID=3152295 RepID=UPI00325E8321